MIDGPGTGHQGGTEREIENAPDPRFPAREVMSALVRHLHAFIREVKLSEVEFQQAAAVRQRDRAEHQRLPQQKRGLMSGSLGVSTLVCLLNNGNNGQVQTTANLAGPFWPLRFARYPERRLDRALANAPDRSCLSPRT